MTHFLRICFWPVFFLSHFLSMALLAWHILAQLHFAYPIGYSLLGLETHIAEYAPLNRYKEGFSQTSKEDHWHLFGEISDAVQNNGKGLNEIKYTLNNGQSIELMHEAEIIHLRDVANLIDLFYVIGISCGFIWLSMLGAAWLFKLTPPSLSRVSLGFIGAIASITMVILIIGAKKVFYWLHTQVFPDNHQWFFYYQDSLMTTLMKAPDIFAFITLLLMILLVGFWGTSYWAMTRFLPAQVKSPGISKNTRAKKKQK